MAKKKSSAAVASMNPSNFVAGGLIDDFEGTITRARFAAWDYGGSRDEPGLFVLLSITPDEGEGDPFEQYYSCGDMRFFQPSMDGEEPTDWEDNWDDEDDREDGYGVYAIQVGKKEALSNNTNWAQFLQSLMDAGFEDWSASLEGFEGLHGHWNRIPQPRRPGIVADEDSERRRDILVITELTEGEAPAKKKATTKKKAAKKTSKKADPEPEEDDDNSELADAVLELVVESGDDGVQKRKVATTVAKSLGLKGRDRAVAMKTLNDEDFLNGIEGVHFDEDEGVLYDADLYE